MPLKPSMVVADESSDFWRIVRLSVGACLPCLAVPAGISGGCRGRASVGREASQPAGAADESATASPAKQSPAGGSAGDLSATASCAELPNL